MKDPRTLSSVRIALVYLLFGVCWILVTDWLAARAAPEPSVLIVLQTLKGWLFVGASAALVFWLVRRERIRWERTTRDLEGIRGLLDRVLGTTSDAVLLVHARTRTIVDCNPAAIEMFGYDREELVGASTKIVHVDPEHYRKFGEESEAVLESERSYRTEARLRRKNGDVFPTEQVVTHVAGEPGADPKYAVSFIRDITDRVAAEQTVRESRDLLEAIVEATSDGVFVKELSGEILFANAGAARMLGRSSSDEVVGRLDEEFFTEKTLAGIREVDRQVVRSERPLRVEEHIVTRDGKDRIYDVVVAPLDAGDDDGAGAVVGVARDVTEQRRTEKALRETNRLLDAVVEGTSDAIFAKDLAGRYLMINSAGARRVGRSVEEVLGATDRELFRADVARKIRRDDLAVIESGNQLSRTEEVETSAGERMVVDTLKAPLMDDDEVVGVIGIARDITKREETRRALERTEEKYQKLFHATPLGISVSTLDGSQFLEVNEGFEELVGYRREELLGRRALELEIWLDRGDRRRLTQQARNADEVRGIDARLRRGDGEVIEAQVFGEVLEIGGKEHLLAVTRNVTEQRRFERQLHRMALHDSLTGLANRALFRDRLEHALATAERRDASVAVLFLDLDRFKVVNDTLGHPAGDRLLEQAASRIASCFRDEDTVARLGGDEFGILLEGLTAVDEVEQAVRRLVEEFEQPFHLLDEQVHQSASVGIALSSERLSDPDDLIRFSDIAMYRAKQRRGSAYHVFDPDIDAEAAQRLHRENELRRALTEGEFELFFQPTLDLATEGVVGAEALIRWHHPERGLIYPGEFIPLAEDTGLVVPIGEWVLDEAVRTLTRWRGDLLAPVRPFRMSVNVSGRQYEESDFSEWVLGVLDRTGLAPRDLQLEITESVAMRGRAEFEPLRELGVALAIDDLGTGYSSLQYLLSMEADVVKIDRSFIGDLAKGSVQARLVNAVLDISEATETVVVAEGIETEEQLTILKELGCPLGQGYHFSRPVPAPEFEKLL